MRILIISGDYKCANIGDVAMLQAAVERLTQLWPDITIHVLTDNPAALSMYCPGVSPLPYKGLRIWCSGDYLIGGLRKALPKTVSQFFINLHRSLRQYSPALLWLIITVKMRLRGTDDSEVRSFLEAFRRADAVVACGQAALNDLVRSHTLLLLDLLEIAVQAGKSTAMFSLGIGPLNNLELRLRAAATLPKIDLIALRERQFGWPILETLGVEKYRVLTTGDDSIEMAYRSRQGFPGDGLGVNIRVAEYARVDSGVVDAVRPLLQEFVTGVGALFVPIPISRHEDLRDATVLRQLMSSSETESDGGRNLDTPLKVIEEAGRCRIVVTGAYHGAVFALSQGIPAICLVGSEYVANKFSGLRAEFGSGCEIVHIDDPDFEQKLSSVIRKVWDDAEELHVGLLEAARKQIEIGRDAYQIVRGLFESRRRAA